MSRDDPFIPETTRAELLALGIPASKHNPESLAAYFPRDFNITALGLSTEDLARVLVHFVREKIIPWPQRKTPVARKVGPGWHTCHFYREFQQLLAIIAPYIAEGLKQGDACFWVLPQAMNADAARHALSHHVTNVESYVASGQLEMLAHRDWYLTSTGALKSFEELAEGFQAKQDRALAHGFKLLRAAGDAGWISGTEQSRAFVDYEVKVNAALQRMQTAALCVYRADVTAEELIAIVNAHQDAFYQTVPA